MKSAGDDPDRLLRERDAQRERDATPDPDTKRTEGMPDGDLGAAPGRVADTGANPGADHDRRLAPDAATDDPGANRRRVEGDTPAARPAEGGPTIRGNAPRGPSPVGSGSGANLSGTVAAGTAGHMGQVGPGTSVQAAMGATDEQGEGFGTARGTWTREDPAKQRRADDVPIADPRPEGQRPKSDA